MPGTAEEPVLHEFEIYINGGGFECVEFCQKIIGRITIILATAAFSMTTNVFAENIWDVAQKMMKDVYNQILLISTIAAVVTAAIALLLMNFSKSGKTVDESRAWLKRIVITWVILNSLGFIISYVQPFLSGGKWNG